MASCRLLIKPSAAKELEGLPTKERKRVVTRMRALSTQPRPPGCEKLTGHDLFRVRQGRYRILYEVQDQDLVVTVFKIGHRRDVYR
ncbi:MAG TPA: type II toxin-antitoxin system RelE/ParE family toxin [Methylomirabilota bacterium]|nr:type II toxin-antitoxin system RelE/ParE family toxin [Methylomirabilota bacterium]